MSSPLLSHIQTVLEDPRLSLHAGALSADKIGRISRFCLLLEKWNRKINLTGEKDAPGILEKHVFDSLQYLRWIGKQDRVLDIGSGGGFPGIPVKIIYPGIDLTLIESQRKRCSFLEEAVRTVELDRITVINARAEQLGRDHQYSHYFDRVLFRGFSSIAQCLDMGREFVNDTGRIILKKGPAESFPPEGPGGQDITCVQQQVVEGFHGEESRMMVFAPCST
ncbi:MAG: 16S rRNA (guanine(527)-N(7))-methyltransferase RsmG [Nitrospinaceae bacterium]|nr:16S rRNA (guanine(527)-N(7))-methyltransferase RsmG [Nitrospinaceae bacterium]NIR54706.1 16S rRNA (guanine(527)-N(7))-methyltransferase RsmG [Nitrospinaceae bacterium]NIS85127.1 16S rRNA (guanine(527)-N(7))-methyltransferase RsmG [Nitrospinaceae bacterium]NIT81944.1 16S rRNA (guanine(527)-N(7))-methyltransferase RsmG [Nitrospinaceae bacterium]NIU44205.1 16S rRNA (guanine(527)-N(7))-methyltransferase RsmG [Nitrospinaceae bacterium]